MQDRLERVPGPVAVATVARVFDPRRLTRMEAQFAGPVDWTRHDASFYRCFMAEIDDALPAADRADLRQRVAAALDLELAGPVRVTAQRMEVGDGADRHSDRPLVGYECARLIVQLDTPEGGAFHMVQGSRVWLDRPSVRNQGLALELAAGSDHLVTPCRSLRRTVVVHFWHRANPPHARDLVHGWLAPMSFAELPRELDPLVERADQLTSDEVTGRAARVAWLLGRWGAPPATLVGAFQATLDGASPGSDAEARARFVVGLMLDAFDRSAYEGLSTASRSWWLEALGQATPR